MNFQARKSRVFNEYQNVLGLSYNDALKQIGVPKYGNITSFDLFEMEKQIGEEKLRLEEAKTQKLIITSPVPTPQWDQDRRDLKDFLERAQRGEEITLIDLPLTEAIKEIKISPNNNLIVNIGRDYFTIANQEQLEEFKQKLFDVFYETEELKGSDAITNVIRRYGEIPEYSFIIPKYDKTQPKAAFFKYYHKLDKIDLTRYGIYKNKDEAVYDDNCLELALLMWKDDKGIDVLNSSDIDKVKLKIKTRYVPQSDLKVIAETLDIGIVLSKLDSSGNHKQVKFNIDGKRKELKLGMFDEHYFIIEKTNYTLDCIKYYDQICDTIDFNKKVFDGKTFKCYNNRFTSSFRIIKELISNKAKYLIDIDLTNCGDFTFHKKVRDYSNLKPISKNEAEPCKYYPIGPPAIFKTKVGNKTIIEDYEVEYFDTEAFLDTKYHTAYMLCSETRSGEKRTFEGDYCVLNWLKSFKTNKILIAHNLRYDFQFVIRYIGDVSGLIKTGQKIKSVQGVFHNKDTGKSYKLLFKDSSSLIESKLENFPEMFKLQDYKQIFPYHAYTSETVKKKTLPVLEATKAMDIFTKKDFLANLKNLKLFVDDTETEFYHMKYAKFYCEQDVNVLKQGYEIFREWMRTATTGKNEGIDIDNVVSLPQLAFTFGLSEGVFDGCYKISGVARDFIQRCVVGGRCMTRNNRKFKIEHLVDDFDGVSLYPSAMARIPGFLKGKPKVITDDMIASGSWKYQSGYFVCINVKDVRIKRNFPLISKKDPETQVRNFSNDIRGIIYVDKFMLEDLCKYHDIDFEVLRGYYFNEGRNTLINDFIVNLFNLRKKKKEEKNPIESVYKLIMNAFYGKTIMKPIEDKFNFVYGKDKCEKHLQWKFNFISEYTKLTDTMWMFKEKLSISDHMSLPHIGAEILSVSKTIMNEVMCLAEDNGIEIYYQDTDSMHIDRRSIYTDRKLTGPQYLAELFALKYNRELIGKNLGQFHSDFAFETLKGEEEPVSVKSIYCGKKSYYDLVRYKPCKDINGNVLTSHGDHCRLKGIPNELIYQKTKELGFTSVEQLYNKMLTEDGEKDAVEFDFRHITKFNFKVNSDFTTSKYEKFTRKVKFPKNKD